MSWVWALFVSLLHSNILVFHNHLLILRCVIFPHSTALTATLGCLCGSFFFNRPGDVIFDKDLVKIEFCPASILNVFYILINTL